MNSLKRLVCLAAIVALAAVATVAQDSKREAQLRTVHGVVQDKSENLVSESVVFLKNTRTNVVRSSYTDTSGNTALAGSIRMQTTKSTPKKKAPNRQLIPFRVLTA